MKRWNKVFCIVTAAALLLTMGGCSNDEETPPVVIPTGPSDTQSTTTVPVAPSGVNMITGLADMGDTELTRPVGVMVANNDFIQDEQVGLSQADMWVEAETEGGITRMMAIFANTERVPEAIGPVRSARTPFAKIVEALDLGYVHAGGSYTALSYIRSSDIADLDVDGGDNGGDYSWRDSSYPHAYEYRLRTSGEYLTEYMSDRGYSTTALTAFPWDFDENQTGETAQTISVKMSGAQRIGFKYDSTEGVYYKNNGSSETRHCDISGSPITAKTVLVLYTDKYWENDTTIDFYLQTGKGYVFSDGVMRRFDWTRDGSGFTMTEEDGTQLTIAAGKVYMCVVAMDYSSGISYGAA